MHKRGELFKILFLAVFVSIISLLIFSSLNTSKITGNVIGAESVSLIRENCAGYSNCFTSLSDWEAAYGNIDFTGCTLGDLICANKIAVARIEGTWSSPDAKALTINGWATDADHYIKIYTTTEARHKGTAGTGYRNVGAGDRITYYTDFITFDGLEVESTSARGFRSVNGSINGEIKISNCLIHGSGTSYGIAHSNQQLKVWNNIIYNFNIGISDTGSSGSIFIYSNTLTNCSSKGINGLGSGRIYHLKNNLVDKCASDYSFSPGSTKDISYCASSDSTANSFGGTGNRANQTFSFADGLNKNFHLSSSDAGAKDQGVDLSSDAGLAFTTDIDGETRSPPWDIGADEFGGASCVEEFQSTTCGAWVCGSKINNCGNPVNCGFCNTNYLCTDGVCILQNQTQTNQTQQNQTQPQSNQTTNQTQPPISQDTTPPIIFQGQPTGALVPGTKQIFISVATDEPSTCRFSTSPGMDFSLMNQFSTTGDVSHSQLIQGLNDNQAYNYYIKCNDVWGNVNQIDYEINFSVESGLPPPCILTNAYWSKRNATEGEAVELTVEGSNCDGKQINFAVWEDDIFGSEKLFDDPANINPPSSIFANGIAKTLWTAEWQDDCNGLCNPPEYYFIATLQENNLSIDSKNNNFLNTYQTSIVQIQANATQNVSGLKITHPRLMNQEWIDQLTRWSNEDGGNWEPWLRFKTYADGSFGNPVSEDYKRLFAKSLMWKIGKGDVYLNDSLNKFDSVVEDVDETNIDDIKTKITYIAYTYDLLYYNLSASSQKNAVDKFIQWQDIIKNHSNLKHNRILWNYAVEKWVPAFVVAAAGAYDPSNSPNDLIEEYNFWKINHYEPSLYLMDKVFRGAMNEGTYYGTVIDSSGILRAADVVYNAEGINVYSDNEWFSKHLIWEWQEYSIPYKFMDPKNLGDYGWYYHAWGHSERVRATVPFAARLNILQLLTRMPNAPYSGQVYDFVYNSPEPTLNKAPFDKTYGGAIWSFLYGAKDLASKSESQSLKFWYTNLHKEKQFDSPDYEYGPGYVFMRTGYHSDDIYISAKFGDMLGRNHDSLAEGTFQLWARGEDLAISSGAYDGDGRYSQTADYFSRTVAKNGLIIYDPNEKFFNYVNQATENDNDGGERVYTNAPQIYEAEDTNGDGITDKESAFKKWLNLSYQGSEAYPNPPGFNVMAKLLRVSSLNNVYSYLFSDLTRVYNSNEYVEGASVGNKAKVSKVTRELSLINNKYFVIFDRVLKKCPTGGTVDIVDNCKLDSETYPTGLPEGMPRNYQDKWLLHTPTNFIVNGNEAIVSDGEQLYTNSDGSFSTYVKNFSANGAYLYGKVVYPDTNFQIRKFNGAKQFWDYHQNVQYYINNVINWYDIKWGQDRLEIEPTDANLDHNYLVVLYPANSSDASMPLIDNIKSTDGIMLGSVIHDAEKPQIIMFSKDNSIRNLLVYNATYSGTGTHIITSLEFGVYEIKKDGMIIGSFTTTSEGVLTFDSLGGSIFEVRKTGLPSCQDSDGDGYGLNCVLGVDCNDNNASINPGAIEICDGVDNNCNGQIDEGGICGLICQDKDSDGFTSKLCGGTDCNDADSSVQTCHDADKDSNGCIELSELLDYENLFYISSKQVSITKLAKAFDLNFECS